MNKIKTRTEIEINRLHSELCGLAGSSLEKAIRIGELLTEQKAELKHGEWLPWVKENLEFSEVTARRYIRCHLRRDELKSVSVTDLSDAYRMLFSRDEKPLPQCEGLVEDQICNQNRFVPPEGYALIATGCARGCEWIASIWPSYAPGFVWVELQSSAGPDGGCTVDWMRRPIRMDHVEACLKLMGAPLESLELYPPFLHDPTNKSPNQLDLPPEQRE